VMFLAVYHIDCKLRTTKMEVIEIIKSLDLLADPEYKGYSIIGDKFDINKKSKNPEKTYLNKQFLKLIKESGSEKVLVLDGGHCQTTRIIKDYDPEIVVIVPNPDPSIVSRLRKAGAWAYPMRVCAFLKNLPMLKVSSAWMDYCGTYDGNQSKGLYPRDDLSKLWSSGLIKEKEVIVAETFCLRGSQYTIDDIISDQLQMAEENGWSAVHTETYKYNKCMVYLTFKASYVGAAPDLTGTWIYRVFSMPNGNMKPFIGQVMGMEGTNYKVVYPADGEVYYHTSKEIIEYKFTVQKLYDRLKESGNPAATLEAILYMYTKELDLEDIHIKTACEELGFLEYKGIGKYLWRALGEDRVFELIKCLYENIFC